MKIEKLLQNPDFLLFLNANDINIVFQKKDDAPVTAGRKTVNREVHLLCNNNILSRWYVHTTDPISVDSSIRKSLEKDFNTPPKLKTATEYEISFAISLNEKGEMQEVKESVLYTFLPTSYKNLGLPFLVNANFITDAGRQQLHQNSEWNRLIFSSIPEHFFKWIATLSPKFEDYHKILPALSPKSKDDLTEIYTTSLKKAIEETPFIPRLKDKKVIKAKDAIIDKYAFGKAVSDNLLVDFINKNEHRLCTEDSFIKGNAMSLMKSYGVYVFDKTSLLHFLLDKKALESINIDLNVKLLKYLYDFCLNEEDDSIDIVKHLPHLNIIYDDDCKLNKGENLLFPSVDSDFNEINTKLSFVNGELYKNLPTELRSWMAKAFGIKELCNLSVIEHILAHPESVDIDNAIEIGRFLYTSWNRENYLEKDDNLSKMQEFPFLSTKGKLIQICNLYLASKYHPEDDLEPIFEDIDYISPDYVESNDWENWVYFLKKCGIRYSLGITNTIIKVDSEEGGKYTKKYDFLSTAASSLENKKHKRSNYCGYKNLVININLILHYFSYIDPSVENLELYKYVFSKLLSHKYSREDFQDRITGEVTYWHDKMDDPLNAHTPYDFNQKYNSYLEYIVAKEQRFPNVMHGFELARNTYLNTPTILKYGAKYLPIIDIDATIDNSWLDIIPFKRDLSLSDYLLILKRISDDQTKIDKELIASIYERLVEQNYQNDLSIHEWGKKNTLLSATSEKFLPTCQLSYITIDGFRKDSQIYIGKDPHSNREGVMNLLQNFGVKVITNEMIQPSFENEVESDELRNLLQEKLDFITLLKDEVNDSTSFEKAKEDIDSLLKKCLFYHCDRIELSYGDKNDVIDKKTFSKGNSIYYVGKLTPTRLEPITASLSKLLNLKASVAHQLFVILITNNRDELIEYLIDNGYPIDFLPNPKNIKGEQSSSVSYEERDSDEVDSEQLIESERHTNASENSGGNITDEKEFIKEYSERVIEFIGGGFSMPKDEIKSKNLIARYRGLMYIKENATYLSISPDFDEKEYIRSEKYSPIRLADGKNVHVQSVIYGIWYLPPSIWNAIVNQGHYACLCTGFGEHDFMIIKDKDDIKSIAEGSNNVLMKMSPSDSMDIMSTIKSVLNPDNFTLVDGIRLDTIYADRNVHLMLKIHQTPDSALNSIFDQVFKLEGDFGLD